MNKSKLKRPRIRPGDPAGRGFRDELVAEEREGDEPESCNCSNFQAKSTLFSILPTKALMLQLIKVELFLIEFIYC